MENLRPKTFSEVVGEALGRASTAWSEAPKGIFDSDTCSVLHIDIMNMHEAEKDSLRAKIKELEINLHQAMGALGYPVPGDIPEGKYRCGMCAVKNTSIERLETEVFILKTLFDRIINKLVSR